MERLALWWERLPEFARWLLYLPTVLIVYVVLNLVQGVAIAIFTNNGVIWSMVIQSAIAASILFPLAMGLAPRGKRVAGWCFYVLLMTFCGLVLILMTARRLAMWGLLGEALRAPPGELWTTRDWGEWLQCIVWLTVGTYAFRSSLDDLNREALNRSALKGNG